MINLKSILCALSLAASQYQVLANDVRLEHEARETDLTACSYHITKNFSFYRDDRTTPGTCAGSATLLKNNVEDFKIPSHSKDTALAYFVVKGPDRPATLWHINNIGKAYRLTSIKDLKFADGFYRYSLIDDENSEVVLLALDNNGTFQAWNHVRIIGRWSDIVEYRLNKQAPPRAFIAFAIDSKGFIYKIRGRESPSLADVDKKKSYPSLSAYFAEQNIAVQ